MPSCHDALSGKLIEQAGFEVSFMSGFTTSGAKIARPDCGLITYSEMLEQARLILDVTTIPLIVDGDNGYGNAMNVQRTLKGYADAGVAGILLEDQKVPKSCGHVQNKEVVSRPEAVSRVRAAVLARDENPSEKDRIVIIARTDSRQAVSFEETLWRIEMFCQLNADMVFCDALESEDEMRQVCKLASSYGKPVLANMLESGKTPILSLDALTNIGFKLSVYPLPLLGVCIGAMQEALRGLKEGKVPQNKYTFDTIKQAVGFPDYFKELAEHEKFGMEWKKT
jgi:2-methylisocitrate lyase-like PEP mutase family enzyme